MMIRPNWPASSRIIAFTTTRKGGVSEGSFKSLNLSSTVGDNPISVMKNREIIARKLPPRTKIKWLQQEHGGEVIIANHVDRQKADASWTCEPGWACAIQTADCLPVLLCDFDATCIAAAHVGWRGLLCDVLTNIINAVPVESSNLMAWLGPRIGPTCFKVGKNVRDRILIWIVSKGGSPEQFLKDDPESKSHYLVDLSGLATLALSFAGVSKVYAVDNCSYLEPELFFSYRRDAASTGRMATLITLKP